MAISGRSNRSASCREETGCQHFHAWGAVPSPIRCFRIRIAAELGLPATLPSNHVPQPFDKVHGDPSGSPTPTDWRPHLQRLIDRTADFEGKPSRYLVKRLKGWLKIAAFCGNFAHFDAIKRAETVEELFALLPDQCADIS